MALIYLALGFIAGVGVIGSIGIHKFLQYQKVRDSVEQQNNATLQNDFKQAVLEAALRGAGGPLLAERDEYFEQ